MVPRNPLAARVVCLSFVMLGPLVWAGCGGSTTQAPPAKPATPPLKTTATSKKSTPRATKTVPSPFRFESIGKESGIDFVQVSGMDEQKFFPSANGSGAAIFDYDGDGKMDLYFATCNTLPLAKTPKMSNRLYKNLGNGKFQDVTEKSGVGFRGFNHGIIAFDADNDGDTDLLLCNYGFNVFYLNNGNGTFRDESEKAGVHVSNWSSSGAAIDYDNDGDLDVYVSNYGSFALDKEGKEHDCGNKEKHIRQYCSPSSIKTVKHILYRNDGLVNGVPHFTDVTKEAGIDRADGHGFGVVAADLDGDGKIDLFVANDQTPSFTFLNKGDGTFTDFTTESGLAVNDNGKDQAGMGADAEDADGDGMPDVIRTNFNNEPTSFYQNQGKGLFLEQSAFVGLAGPSMPYVKWGCSLSDFDNDGFLDVFVSNGHVDDNYHLLGDDTQPYKQPPLMFRHDGVKGFQACDTKSGEYFATGHVGRGAAFGDLDDDGRMDIVVNHKDDAPGVLLNKTPSENHWIRLKLQGTKTNRDAIGARVEITVNGRTIVRQKKGGGSMESTNDPRLLIGLGKAETIESIVVKWPSGGPDSVLKNVKVDQTLPIVESKDATKPIARTEP